MSYFAKNSAALAKIDAIAASKIQRRAHPVSGIKVQRCDGVVTFTNGNESVVFDTVAQFKLDDEPQAVLIYGFGDGQLIREFLKVTSQAFVLVVEPHFDVITQIMDCCDLSDIFSHDRIRVIIGQQNEELVSSLNRYFSDDFSRLSAFNRALCFMPPQLSTFFDYVSQQQHFLKILEAVSQSLYEVKTPEVEDSFWGLMNTLQNSPDYFAWPHFNAFASLFAGKPGVVVATGPSLHQSLPSLKKWQDRVVIFCCDSALKTLIDFGINPDFVGSLERLGQIQYLFDNVQELTSSYLVAPAVLAPESFSRFPGKKIRMTRDITFDHWVVPTDQGLNIGASSAHLCLVGLHHLGCHPIYLIGQDLAYDPKTGQSHVASAPQHVLKFGDYEKEKIQKVKKFEVQGNDGNKVLTTEIWHDFAKKIPELIEYYQIPQVLNVISADHGMALSSVQHILPDQLDFSKDQPLDKSGQIASVWQKENSSDFKIDEKRLNRCLSALRQFQSLSMGSLREISQFWMRYDIRIKGKGHEEKYREFFVKLENMQAKILSVENGFFENDFMSLIERAHIHAGLSLSRVQNEESDINERIIKQLKIMKTWFGDVYFWSSRAQDYLEYVAVEKWNLKEVKQ